MSSFFINGGNKLRGDVSVDCAKNALLPIMAACVLNEGVVTFENAVPYLDVLVMKDILTHLGAKVEFCDTNLTIDTRQVCQHVVPLELAGKLRASIFLLGPLLGRMKKAKMAYPGGCNIGLRPIDLHLNGLRLQGACINEKNGYIYAEGENLHSNDIILDFPSVGATENLIMSSVLTNGTTHIYNPAKEPEIVDLQNFLNKCGAKISGAGGNVITITGVKKLAKNIKYHVMPDRIIAGTLMIACAMCGGEITLNNSPWQHNQAIISKLKQSACQFSFKDDKIFMKCLSRPKSFGKIQTAAYPGFPTDLQAQAMALQTISEGICLIEENLFEARFKHVCGLTKMGADIKCHGNICIVNGKERLFGAEVIAEDLRGGASLVLAGLASEGYTRVYNIDFIDRGYYKLEKTLSQLGADIVREVD